ncbi:hypothetical protein DASC09_014920 [Saccharomycopsis crataegensis]|uniref:Uncharacterized protein n=1 Tax=Saccharomycopsis crataegensis TaxID=43959 RepID=A0AAV5QHA5_9ASCO|nr:hypothetical protein DASC09_014920 [Saccharomycopsis crataegensis]
MELNCTTQINTTLLEMNIARMFPDTQGLRPSLRYFIKLSLKKDYPVIADQLSQLVNSEATDVEIITSVIGTLFELYGIDPCPSIAALINSNLLSEIVVGLNQLPLNDKQGILSIEYSMMLFEILHDNFAVNERNLLIRYDGLGAYIWEIIAKGDFNLANKCKKVFNLYCGNSIYQLDSLDEWIIETFIIPALQSCSNVRLVSFSLQFLARLHSVIYPSEKILMLIGDLLKPTNLKPASSPLSASFGILKKQKKKSIDFNPDPIIVETLLYFTVLFAGHKSSIPELEKAESIINLSYNIVDILSKIDASFEVHYYIQLCLSSFFIIKPNFDARAFHKLWGSNILMIHRLLAEYKIQKAPEDRVGQYDKDILVVSNFKFFYQCAISANSALPIITTNEDFVAFKNLIQYILDHWEAANITSKNASQALIDLVVFCIEKVKKDKSADLLNKLSAVLMGSNSEVKEPILEFLTEDAYRHMETRFIQFMDAGCYSDYIIQKVQNTKSKIEKSNYNNSVMTESDEREFMFIGKLLIKNLGKPKSISKIYNILSAGDYFGYFMSRITEIHSSDVNCLICLLIELTHIHLFPNEDDYAYFSALFDDSSDMTKRNIMILIVNSAAYSKISDPIINYPMFLMKIYSLAMASENATLQVRVYRFFRTLIKHVTTEKKEILSEILREWDFFYIMIISVLEDPTSILQLEAIDVLRYIFEQGFFQEEVDNSNVLFTVVNIFHSKPKYRYDIMKMFYGFCYSKNIDSTQKERHLLEANFFLIIKDYIEFFRGEILEKENFTDNSPILRLFFLNVGYICVKFSDFNKKLTSEQHQDLFRISLKMLKSSPNTVLSQIGIEYITQLVRALDFCQLFSMDNGAQNDEFCCVIGNIFSDILKDQKHPRRDNIIKDICCISEIYVSKDCSRVKNLRASYYLLEPMLRLMNEGDTLGLQVSNEMWAFFAGIIDSGETPEILTSFFDKLRMLVPSYGSIIMNLYLAAEQSNPLNVILFSWNVVIKYPNSMYAKCIFNDFGFNEVIYALRERFQGDVTSLERLSVIENSRIHSTKRKIFL